MVCVLQVGSRLFVCGGSTGSSNFKGYVDGTELVNELWVLDMKSYQLRYVCAIA